jgi:hypothetical protein
MCLTEGELLFYLFLMGAVFLGIPALIIFLICKLIQAKNKLP